MANYFNVHADPTARISPKASILGDVTIGSEATIFGGAYIRGDMAPVRIGANSNVQECVAIHVDTDYPCTVGDNVTIGHGAIVHGCTIADNCLVGMGSVVMNGAVIGEGCLIAAGAHMNTSRSAVKWSNRARCSTLAPISAARRRARSHLAVREASKSCPLRPKKPYVCV